MTAEDKYALALAVICVLLLSLGTVFARWLSRQHPRIVRIVWPLAAVATLAMFAGFVLIARLNAH